MGHIVSDQDYVILRALDIAWCGAMAEEIANLRAADKADKPKRRKGA